MTTYATGNPVGSTAVKDLYDNAENLDIAVNSIDQSSWVDRRGVRRKTFSGMEADIYTAVLNAGYVYTNPSSYQAGIIITQPNQIFSKDGEFYKASPSLALPYTTTGNWATEQSLFSSVGDATLRGDLSAANGAQNVNGAQAAVASIAALKALSVAKASKWATVQNAMFVSFYRYDAASVATADDVTVVAPNTGAGRWLINHNGSMSLYQWGAKGDKVTDDTAAVQAAVNWASPDALELVVPACLGFRLTAPILCAGSPRLRGQHIQISKTIQSLLVNETGKGAWFFLDHLGIGFSFNDGGVVVTRPRLEMIGTYRNQPVPSTGTPYVPLSADFDFRFYNCDSVIRDIVLWNATRGIQITCNPTASQSRGDIQGIYGYPLQIGVQVDFIADVLRIDNTHFWPYWSSNPEVIKYVAANSIGMLLKRCDNPFITRYFTYGYRFSLATEDYLTYGSVSKLKLVEFDFDFFGESAIYINGSGGSYNLTNGSGQGQSATAAQSFLEFSPASNGNNVSVTQVDAGLCARDVFRVAGINNNVLRLGTGIRCYNWNGSGQGFPAVACSPDNIVVLEALPEFTAPLNGGLPLDQNGVVRATVPLSFQTLNTDANALAVVTSGLGRLPKSLVASVVNASTAIVAQPTGGLGQLRFYKVSDGTPFINSAVSISAMMIFE